MSLTLLIPYHSKPHLLEFTLRSILAQSSPHWNTIVCDDSNDDSAKKVIENFTDSRISYAKNPNPSGMVGNWNFAVGIAKSDWISIIHADDELETDYVRLMQQMMEHYPDAAMLYCKAKIIDIEGKPIFSFPDYIKTWIEPQSKKELILKGEAAVSALLKGNFIFCPTACYRREVISKFPFEAKYKMVQDLEIYLRMLMDGFYFVGSQEKAYRYRRHENATALLTQNQTRFNEEIDLYRNYSLYLNHLGWIQAAAIAQEMRIIRLHLLYRVAKNLISFQWARAYSELVFYLKNFHHKS